MKLNGQNSRIKARERLRKTVSVQITQLHEEMEITDLWPPDSDLLACAYQYVPIKILNDIARRHEKRNKKMIKEKAEDETKT